jgi:hypothetical protein
MRLSCFKTVSFRKTYHATTRRRALSIRLAQRAEDQQRK